MTYHESAALPFQDRGMQPERNAVLRDAVVFAVKLWIDSIKDIVLAFVGLGAAVVDVIRTREGQRPVLFYRVMRMGAHIDYRLDLYGARAAEESLDREFPL